jgi:hypothetical protein
MAFPPAPSARPKRSSSRRTSVDASSRAERDRLRDVTAGASRRRRVLFRRRVLARARCLWTHPACVSSAHWSLRSSSCSKCSKCVFFVMLHFGSSAGCVCSACRRLLLGRSTEGRSRAEATSYFSLKYRNSRASYLRLRSLLRQIVCSVVLAKDNGSFAGCWVPGLRPYHAGGSDRSARCGAADGPRGRARCVCRPRRQPCHWRSAAESGGRMILSLLSASSDADGCCTPATALAALPAAAWLWCTKCVASAANAAR